MTTQQWELSIDQAAGGARLFSSSRAVLDAVWAMIQAKEAQGFVVEMPGNEPTWEVWTADGRLDMTIVVRAWKSQTPWEDCR